MRDDQTGPDRSTGRARNPGRTRSWIDRALERGRELRALQVEVSGRALCVWALISLVVCGLHLSLFVEEFRETWYAPLHFLWVVVSACLVSWWCLRSGGPEGSRGVALLQAGAFLAASCVISWAVARTSWGGGVVGEARLPAAGGALILASLLLVAVSPFLVRSGIPGGVSRKAGRS